MKVIDLFVKQANGEELPRHIKLNDTEWYWNDYDGYVDKWSLSTTPDAQHYLYNHYRLDFCLDDEIEIIEEPKKIEKLNYQDEAYVDSAIEAIFFRKINEIIEAINERNI